MSAELHSAVLPPPGVPLRHAVEHLLRSVNSALAHDMGRAHEHLHRAITLLNLDPRQLAHLIAAPPVGGIPSGSVRGGLASWQIQRVINYVEAHLETGPLQMPDLAALIGLSPSYFSMAFRRSVGDTPHAFILQRRVAKAQRMMLNEHRSLVEIAAACGFADQAHFTRVFRRALHETPSAWRRARCPSNDERERR